MTKTHLIIPTLNSAQYIDALTEVLSRQTLPAHRIEVVDSESTDGSAERWMSSSVRVQHIPRAKFNHGGARNIGAATADRSLETILVFMTQDALPKWEGWLDALVVPIHSGEAVATFARQLPRPEAGLLEQFSRYFNYPERSQSRTAADIERLGVKAFFFSNVCSAVRADVFWELGGFPEDVIMNEDMALAARLLRAGHTIRYVAEAEVIHSHDYTLRQQFRRNFDVGAFFADAGPELKGASVGGEGLRFVREQMRYVWRHRRPDLLPLVIVEAAAKFTAFQLGKRHRLLPIAFKKKLSMHSYHWDQQRSERKEQT